MKDFDVCIIGSGAGGGPVALTLAEAGFSVLVLEKGPFFQDNDFYKDEITAGRRSVYTPDLRDEPHVVETQDYQDHEEKWVSQNTYGTSWNFWNGNMVGGATNLMSGYFYRLKPIDFKLLSTFGPIDNASIMDWPISYEDLEPYYTKVEKEVGISGKVTQHVHAEPRSTSDFPFPPLIEHPVAQMIDKSCQKLGYHSLKVPRAIISESHEDRNSCSYSGYCGSYGCATGAKGSSRVSLLPRALKTKNCEIRPYSKVYKLVTDKKGKVTQALYFDRHHQKQKVDAKIFVVACHAIESARLLLLSTGPKHPQGLGNNNNLVGKNLLFAGGGASSCKIPYKNFPPEKILELKERGTFINRGLQDWYVINDKSMGPPMKGGTIDFIFRSTGAIANSSRQSEGSDGRLVWGKELQKKIKSHFNDSLYLEVEAFCDWLPNPNSFVTLDPHVKDKWGIPVARVRTGMHMHNLTVGWYLANKGANVLKDLGGTNTMTVLPSSPPTNLVAGTCRFGHDPQTSVLDPHCKVHDVDNLYVTDGSFQPTGGSVPYTWTIYANSFRVADKIKERLS